VILDKNGKSYGYFTVNKKFPNRTLNGKANIICERRDDIVEDIPGSTKPFTVSSIKNSMTAFLIMQIS